MRMTRMTPRPRFARSTAALLALALTGAPAPGRAAPATTAEGPATATGEAPRAAADSRLAVLAVTISGAADESTGPQLLEHLKKGLARGAFAVVDAAEVERHAPGGCSEPRCLAALRSGADAAFALRAKISVNDRDYVVHLDLLATQGGAVLATSEERCDLCGITEVGALVEAQSALLRKALEDIIQGPSRLAVTSQPPGALVLVDDKLVGTTPVDQTVLEGQHVVRVMLDGYVTDERKVQLQAGVRERLDLQLARAPKLARSRTIGWAALFTGIPVALAGAGMVAIDGRADPGSCSGPDLPNNGNCKHLFDTDVGGAIALAAGAALITAGVMLLVRTRDRPQPRRTRAFIGPTGAAIVGRF